MPFLDDFDEPYITTEKDLEEVLYGTTEETGSDYDE